MVRLPVLFVSHGSPNLPYESHDAVAFLRGLGQRLPRPRALALLSAHWTTCVPTVSTTARPSTIHDFSGFPDRLYRLSYPAPGAPEFANRAFDLLRQSLPSVAQHPDRGLDHGAWIPISLMYPAADIPCFQISLQPRLGPVGAYALGQALAPLREEGVLLLGSGSIVHNLRELSHDQAQAPEWGWCFEAWIERHLRDHDRAALMRYRELAPAASLAQPTEEHLLPLFAVHDAALREPVQPLFRGFAHGSLSMSAYALGDGVRSDDCDRHQRLAH